MELAAAGVVLSAGLAEILLLAADLLVAPAARQSPSSALPSGQSLGGPPGLSAGQQMRRLLFSLLLAALVVGEAAIATEAALSAATDGPRLPESLFGALRFSPVSPRLFRRPPSLPAGACSHLGVDVARCLLGRPGQRHRRPAAVRLSPRMAGVQHPAVRDVRRCSGLLWDMGVTGAGVRAALGLQRAGPARPRVLRGLHHPPAAVRSLSRKSSPAPTALLGATTIPCPLSVTLDRWR